MQAPNAIVMEKSSHLESDMGAQRIAALRAFAERVHDDSKEFLVHSMLGETRSDVNSHSGGNTKVAKFAACTGNVLIDQFCPWYFGVAFAGWSPGFSPHLKKVILITAEQDANLISFKACLCHFSVLVRPRLLWKTSCQ